MKKVSLQILALTLILVLSSRISFGQGTRINFVTGRSSATVSGALKIGADKIYLVRGRAGQKMTARVVSANGNIVIDEAGDTTWEITLDEARDYEITLLNPVHKTTRYTLTVTIR